MRYLFVLLVLALVGCNEASQPKCEDINGLRVANFDVVPDDYTGVAFICEEGKVNNLENLKDGKYDGVRRRWHENGQLEYEDNWKDGKQDGTEKIWFSSGQLNYEENWKNGKLDGVRRMWYKNGQLRLEMNWKDGKSDGVKRRWHENGQLEIEKNYKDGEIIDNRVIYYNEDGAIYKTKYYEDGKEVRCEGDC